jgi:hypothetical protein
MTLIAHGRIKGLPMDFNEFSTMSWECFRGKFSHLCMLTWVSGFTRTTSAT